MCVLQGELNKDDVVIFELSLYMSGNNVLQGGIMMDEHIEEESRVSLNLRIDAAKYGVLERMRTTGFGFAKTERNRSDVYNEILGYGIQTNELRQQLGDRDFAKLWRILQSPNLQKLNLDAIEKLMIQKDK